MSSWLFFVLTPPMKVEQRECSETSAHKIQTPGYHPKERKQHSIEFKKMGDFWDGAVLSVGK